MQSPLHKPQRRFGIGCEDILIWRESERKGWTRLSLLSQTDRLVRPTILMSLPFKICETSAKYINVEQPSVLAPATLNRKGSMFFPQTLKAELMCIIIWDGP